MALSHKGLFIAHTSFNHNWLYSTLSSFEDISDGHSTIWSGTGYHGRQMGTLKASQKTNVSAIYNLLVETSHMATSNLEWRKKWSIAMCLEGGE